MTTFEERHPGLTEENKCYEFPYMNFMWNKEAIDATQIDKEIVRDAIEKASVKSALLFTERCAKDSRELTPNEIMDGYGSQQDLHACFVECFKKELGL